MSSDGFAKMEKRLVPGIGTQSEPFSSPQTIP